MKPLIAITMGDFNGIGPEIILKSLISDQVKYCCIPIIVGSIDVFEYYASRNRIKTTFKEIDTLPGKNIEGIIPVFHINKFQKPKINPGKISRESGQFAGDAIFIAADLAKGKLIDGIVTAPVSKKGLQLGGYKYPGQTEMLSDICGVKKQLMLFTAKNMKVGLATTHLPLNQVSKKISKDEIFKKIKILHYSLKKDFAIHNPKIAVLGINPHAGEEGLLGVEEKNVIKPAIQKAQRLKIIAEGPFAADAFYGKSSFKNYDAVLAMYHDQGLIPFKLFNFNSGVNVTAGLPIVRTSPDHGTAFDIAGKGIANPDSMIEAIRTAVQIINNRRRYRL